MRLKTYQKVSFNPTDQALFNSICDEANGGSKGEIIKRRLYEHLIMKAVLAQFGPNLAQLGPNLAPSEGIPEETPDDIDWKNIEEELKE